MQPEYLRGLSNIPSKTLRGDVADVLRAAIIGGGLRPGSFINQADLARQLGISRSPLREALGQLEEEGLITIIPYKGAYVTDLPIEFVDELFTLRAVLEEFGVRRAVALATADDVAHLRQLLARMQLAAEAGDVHTLTEIDLAFHRAFVTLADHALLLQTWRGLETRMRRVLSQQRQFSINLRDAIGTHPDLVAALESGDADRAAAAMRSHILDAREATLRTWGSDTSLTTSPVNGVAL